MRILFPALMLVGASLGVSTETADAQKLNVKIVDRRDSSTNYAYTAPAYFNSRSDSNLTCYGDTTCSGSTTTTGSVSPPRSISYQVRGATFTLQLPDGRGAVVNCESKHKPRGGKQDCGRVAVIRPQCRLVRPRTDFADSNRLATMSHRVQT
jgi:hypothetical protein